jgi:hypothetical protein
VICKACAAGADSADSEILVANLTPSFMALRRTLTGGTKLSPIARVNAGAAELSQANPLSSRARLLSINTNNRGAGEEEGERREEGGGGDCART